LKAGQGRSWRNGSAGERLQFFCGTAIACSSKLPPTTRGLRIVIGSACQKIRYPKSEISFFGMRNVVWDIVVSIGHAIEQILIYVETHHWIFGFLAGGYIFYLHDRAVHARFDALDKRVDEIRKRLAIEY
jgi:hypothetical protein